MNATLTHTRISLPEKTRIEMAALLQCRLADSIDLMLQAKQAHWNVKGPNFIALHELFDKVYADTGTAMDTIAERIVQLGGTAQGTIREAARTSALPEYSTDISSSRKHIAELAHAIAFYDELLQQAIAHANKLEDPDTADLFTGVSRKLEQNLWFVEAHEQAEN
jgi:starvation-inducible DNA-binding protein